MLIYALNGIQEHGQLVRQHVEITGNVVLRGCLDPDGNVQLLEGSHRIAFALELGVPITIVLFNWDEVIPNECEIASETTGDKDTCTVREHLNVLLTERGLYGQAVYDAGEHSSIRVIDPAPKTGVAVHRRLIDTQDNPWVAFPERTWQYPWGHCCNVEGKLVLVLGDAGCKQAAAFIKLGADVTIAEPGSAVPDGYDLVYDTVTDALCN
jgi:hypothetical protein